ncbi:MAG TPA: trypsin-like peptidase domain-containing protein [Acidimicrobiales bacterium]
MAAVFAAALLVGGVGYGVGRWSNEPSGDNTAANAPAASTQPIVTEPAPLSGNEAEPAEAVAKVLGPAVVQIETDEGLGSGFIYDKSGLIMTAAHVTDGASTVQVRMADGSEVRGNVVGEDPATDVAVVKIPAKANLPVATLATGITTQVGQTAIAIGSPFGLDQTVTEGIVSAVGRSTQTESGGAFPAIQTDAPINPGNSGGALADRTGRVIGINDSIATASDSGSGQAGNVGVGFAIPISVAKPVADDLVAGRSPQAGYLGVNSPDTTTGAPGALVATVVAGSPAAKAGVHVGDSVTAVDSSKIETFLDLEATIRSHKPGDTVTLTVVRGGATHRLTVTLATAPHN